jgi:transcription initiation factor TFIID subunit 10
MSETNGQHDGPHSNYLYPRMLRLVSLAAQKFVSDVASDALDSCKMRQSNNATTNKKEKKYALTTEDLSLALGDQGVNVRKPPYFQ